MRGSMLFTGFSLSISILPISYLQENDGECLVKDTRESKRPLGKHNPSEISPHSISLNLSADWF